MLRIRRTVRDGEDAAVGIFLRLGVVHALRKNPYVMPADSRDERTLRRDRPGFDVRVQKIGVFFQECRSGFVAPFAEQAGSADQSSDVRGERGGRISTHFLPALLLSDRSMADKVSSRARNHRVRVKILESLLPIELPGEKNRKCDFVKLDSPPVGPAINPKVLRKAAIFLLRHCQINKCAERRNTITSSEHGGSAVDHVASPNQVIPALVRVTLCFSPRDREGGDKCARIGFVFVSAEQAETAVV